jgi:hypothetical protein
MSKEQITRWVPAIGRWDLSQPGRAIYLGPQPEQHRPFGICVCKSRLSEGDAGVTVHLPQNDPEKEACGRILFGYRRWDLDYYSIGVGGYGFAYVIDRYEPGTGWRALRYAGSKEDFRPEPYEIRISVRGLKVILADGEIRLLEDVLPSPVPPGHVGLFAWGNHPVEFTDMFVDERRGTAFVVMQFTPPYTELYEQVIKKVAEEQFKLEAYHAEEAFGRVILQDIVTGIQEATVVIAEITPANKNVFYEVGYAHARNVPTILLVAKGTELPFDIRGYRCILYENTIAGKSKVEEELAHHLRAILNE